METTIEISREALVIALKISLPILCAALVVALIVSLIQALTQVQDQTIVFVPKLLAVFVTLFLLMPYIGNLMLKLNESITNYIIHSQ